MPSPKRKAVVKAKKASAGVVAKKASATGKRRATKAATTRRVDGHSPQVDVAEAVAAAGAAASITVLAVSFIEELRKRDPTGERLKDADPRQAASLAAASILDPSVLWVQQLGAFYDTDGVRTLLGRAGEPVTRQAVSKRKGLLALTTGSGRVVYPAFQFRDRKPVEGLAKVFAVLPEERVSRWTVASWLNSPEPALDGDRPIDVLANDGAAGRQRVVEIAARWSAQLAG